MIDWQTIIIAAVAAIPGTLAGLAAVWQARATHQAVNSRMDTLLKLATDEASAAATLAEKDAEQGRKAARSRSRKR